MDKTVAVIGGSGFIGRAVIERLTREGARVIVLCRNAEKAKFLKTMGVVGQVTLVAGNALNDDDLEQVIAPDRRNSMRSRARFPDGSARWRRRTGWRMWYICRPSAPMPNRRANMRGARLTAKPV